MQRETLGTPLPFYIKKVKKQRGRRIIRLIKKSKRFRNTKETDKGELVVGWSLVELSQSSVPLFSSGRTQI